MSRPLRYPELDDALVRRLIPLAEELNDLAEAGLECSRQLEAFNRIAGTSIEDPLAFHFFGAITAEVFVRDLLARPWVTKFAALNDAELLEIIRSLQNGIAPDESFFWLLVLEINLPGAPISDLIFYPDTVLSTLAPSEPPPADLRPEDVLTHARRFLATRRAIPLGPSEPDDSAR